MKTWIEISENNILHNIQSLKKLLKPSTSFMAVLKSNAYGHGLEIINAICVKSGLVDWYGVDSKEEALILRKLGNTSPILILGYIPYEELDQVIENNISFVAYNLELLTYLENKKYNKKIKIHIKIETGTSRQGIADQELIDFIKKAQENQNIEIEGIYTHYANIEDTTDSTYAMEQLKKFNQNIQLLEKMNINIPIKHSACSAAIINYPETHFNMVRAGISMYGMWSSVETKAVTQTNNINLELKPALTWKTYIAQIKTLKANTPVSYGLTEAVKRYSKVAILPIGYWDGYDRGLSSVGEVLINNKRAKILGRICMNMMIVDITDTPNAKINNEAILLGDQITAEEMARKIGTINYEIVTRINPMIKRFIK